MTDAVSPTSRESLPPVCMSARFGEGGGYGKFLVVKKISVTPPDPPLSQKFADPLTILKFADLRLPTPVFWSSHMYGDESAQRATRDASCYEEGYYEFSHDFWVNIKL